MPQGFWPQMREKLSAGTMLSSASDGIATAIDHLAASFKDVRRLDLMLKSVCLSMAAPYIPPDIFQQTMDYTRHFLPSAAGVIGISDTFRLYAQDVAAPLRTPGESPLSHMQTKTGNMTAYWKDEEWAKAGSLTAGVAVSTVLVNKLNSLRILAAAPLIDSTLALAYQDAPLGMRVGALAAAAVGYGLVHIGYDVVNESRTVVASNLNRLATRWETGRIHDVMAEKGVLGNLDQHGRQNYTSDESARNARKDQVIGDFIRVKYSQAIGLAMGASDAVLLGSFIGVSLFQNSKQLDFLDEWAYKAQDLAGEYLPPAIAEHVNLVPGEYGTFVAACAATLAGIALSTPLALKLMRPMNNVNSERLKAEGEYRSDLIKSFDHASLTAASGGEAHYDRINRGAYERFDQAWLSHINVTFLFGTVRNSYDMIGRGLSWVPALSAMAAGVATFGQAKTLAAQVENLIDRSSWFFHVTDARSQLEIATTEIVKLNRTLEESRDFKTLCSESGIHDFEHRSSEALVLENIRLMRPGAEGKTFISYDNFMLSPGDAVEVRGPNGCGKSSLFSCIAGRFPHGTGRIGSPDQILYATQELDLPPEMTLRKLACYPLESYGYDFSEKEVAEALFEVGLGRYIKDMDEERHNDADWGDSMSGGEQQALILARAILRSKFPETAPKLLLLDEPTAKMDLQASENYHRVIAERFPDAIKMIILHSDTALKPDGSKYYPHLLEIKDQRGTLIRQEEIEAPAQQAVVRYTEFGNIVMFPGAVNPLLVDGGIQSSSPTGPPLEMDF